MLTRREMLARTAQLSVVAALPSCASLRSAETGGVLVNDMQSRLNATRVARVDLPQSLDDVRGLVKCADARNQTISIAGGRHSMGGQQFAADSALLDMRRFNRVANFDRQHGTIRVESGIQWPDLAAYLHETQAGDAHPWTFRQKQTGVDHVTIGGSLASNIHGRGLKFPPFASDIESFDLMDARGNLHRCSRRENAELFSLAIGDYGLFGIVTHVTMRLIPRVKVQRVVELIVVKDLLSKIDQRIGQGYVYGDCQYSIDLQTDAANHPGIFSCYKHVPADTPVPPQQKHLSGEDWARLYHLARTDKKKAFEVYSRYYLSSTGQVYWSDQHQMSSTFQGYRKSVVAKRGTEMITEAYVPRDALLPFLAAARQDFVKHNVDVTYGTIRFIEKDDDSFLAWADKPYVCIVCNLHVVHTRAGKAKAVADFRRIIDRAIEHGGRYYLTYHRWATRRQVETCYPQFAQFLRLKLKYDPSERFQSSWYRHYRRMFADVL